MNWKQPVLALAFLAAGITAQAQTPAAMEGVYTATKNGTRHTWILVDGYASRTAYTDTAFLATEGGPLTFTGDQMEVTVEFNSANADEVARKKTYRWEVGADGSFTVDGMKWRRETRPQELDGAWHITGRMKDGEVQSIRHEGTRKTLKLLKDGWFQWFAIDPGKQAFLGTGGGHYTFQNGQYTEEIVFFSRDNSRVGAKLQFTGELKDGAWHHSGKSSKGEPMYEVWGR